MLFIKVIVETCYEIIFESIGKAHMCFKCGFYYSCADPESL